MGWAERWRTTYEVPSLAACSRRVYRTTSAQMLNPDAEDKRDEESWCDNPDAEEPLDRRDDESWCENPCETES